MFKEFCCVSQILVGMNSRLPSLHMISWKPSDAGEVKLNRNGVISQDQTVASAEGVIRDSNSKWLFGFAMKVGSYSVINAEL